VSELTSQVARRSRQIGTILQAEGLRGLTYRLRKLAVEKISLKTLELPVSSIDVQTADLAAPPPTLLYRVQPGEPLRLNWLMTPPSPGSGGHTTLFRIINYLESHGYSNHVYFYDQNRADYQHYATIVRDFYGFAGSILPAGTALSDAHGQFATSWPTAYPVFNSGCRGKRFYLVQDFEPYFHAVGSLSVLAENTYRMGFHAITAGCWLAEKLRADYGMQTDHFDFGCDIARYTRRDGHKRTGVAFYARPEASRRGYEIGIMALELLAKWRPEIELHFYGDKIGKLPFRFIDHGKVTPHHLNEIYNLCFAGLSLSLTNVSLVPHEMLAAGCIPVVNDAVHNRIVLDNPYVRYAQPSPPALAAELKSIASMPGFQEHSRLAAASVAANTWDDAGARVDTALRRVLLETCN
jgi:glycosyltransferase involved in cell wall biosynthesis